MKVIIFLLLSSLGALSNEQCVQFYPSPISEQKSFLTEMGISEDVAARIARHRPQWISSIKESLKNSDNDWVSENVIWYRGLDLDSIADFTPYKNKAGHYSAAGELWVAPFINTLARYGKIMIQYHMRATEILTYSNEGIALDKKFYDDERVFIAKIGVLKKSSYKTNYVAITENDYTWYTYSELVSKKLMRALPNTKK